MNIERISSNIGTNTFRVSGFTDEEITALKAVDRNTMRQTVIERLDVENNNIGTCWACGYGIYGMHINGNAVDVEVGNTCD